MRAVGENLCGSVRRVHRTPMSATGQTRTNAFKAQKAAKVGKVPLVSETVELLSDRRPWLGTLTAMSAIHLIADQKNLFSAFAPISSAERLKADVAGAGENRLCKGVI